MAATSATRPMKEVSGRGNGVYPTRTGAKEVAARGSADADMGESQTDVRASDSFNHHAMTARTRQPAGARQVGSLTCPVTMARHPRSVARPSRGPGNQECG